MLKTLMQLAANIPAAFVGGGAFLISLFGLQLGVALSFVVGISGYIVAGIWIFPSSRIPVEPDRKGMLNSVLKSGERKLTRMRSFPYQITHYEVRRKITYICEVAEKIFEIVKKNPEDVKTVQVFSSYYLEPTLRILSKYVELSEHKNYSAELQDTLAHVESVLDSVQAAFEKQLSNLLRNEMLDLDMEIALLEETIEIEGI